MATSSQENRNQELRVTKNAWPVLRCSDYRSCIRDGDSLITELIPEDERRFSVLSYVIERMTRKMVQTGSSVEDLVWEVF